MNTLEHGYSISKIFVPGYVSDWVKRRKDKKAYQKKLEDAIKKEYGCTRAKWESFDKFQKRVEETIPSGVAEVNVFLSFVKKYGPLAKDDGVKEVIEKYFGIKNKPLDSFEFKNQKSDANGFAYSEYDGSSVVMTLDMPDNKDKIKKILAKGLEDIMYEKKIEPKMKANTFNSLLIDDNAFNTLHNNLCIELMNNEEFVKLHEGIHALHMDNHERGRKKKNKIFSTNNKVIAASMVPLLKHLLLIPRNNFSIETEAYSHKIGFDAYMDRLIDEVIPTLQRQTGYRFEEKDILAIKDDFHDCSTEFTKRRIKGTYLVARKIYPEKYHLMLAAANYGAASMFADSDNILKYVGFAFGMKAASHLIRATLAPMYRSKANKCADTLDVLSEKYGAETAYYHAIGKDFSELHREAKDYRLLKQDGLKEAV